MSRPGSLSLNNSRTAPQRAARRLTAEALRGIESPAEGERGHAQLPRNDASFLNRAAAREHTTSWSQPGFIPLALMTARAGGLIRYATNSLAAPGSLLLVVTPAA